MGLPLKIVLRTFRKRLRKIVYGKKACAGQTVEPLSRCKLLDADAIVTTNEVTDRHGTGVLLSRIFGECPNILSIRSTSLYREHKLGRGELCFGHQGLSRSESFERVLYALNGSTVRRVFCVPYQQDELITALALKEIFAAPLCLYLMDDNNIFSKGIPDELMREALAKSSLRLAISPELRDAYEQKYRFKFWVAPPVVRDEALQTVPRFPIGKKTQERIGVLVGSLWSLVWLQNLRQTVRESGLQVHWYGNSTFWSEKVTAADLAQDGIVDCGFLAERHLTKKVNEYPYAVVPTGSLDAADDRPELARLSLPTRLPYLLAASNTPTIVLGNPNTAAAHFVERFQTGKVVPYQGIQFRQAVEEVCQPQQQLAFRTRAAGHAPVFSAKGLAGWIWQSLELGEPPDERFEQVFRRTDGDIIPYLEAPPPSDVCGDFVLVYHALRRLKRQGFAPDFVLDVGSSSGVWSDVTKRVFPNARFLLFDPLHAHYAKMNDWFFRKHPDFECLPVAVSDRPGETELNVSPDLYGSSLLLPVDFRAYHQVKVPVITLDEAAQERKLTGRGLLKIDVQFTEHLVLKGAEKVLGQIDALLVELSLVAYAPQARLFAEMCDLIRGLGFRYYEDVGGWRSPVDGTLLQKDVLFVRQQLFVHPPAATKAPPGPEQEPEPRVSGPGVLNASPTELQPISRDF